jgi:hypothetical protein
VQVQPPPEAPAGDSRGRNTPPGLTMAPFFAFGSVPVDTPVPKLKAVFSLNDALGEAVA